MPEKLQRIGGRVGPGSGDLTGLGSESGGLRPARLAGDGAGGIGIKVIPEELLSKSSGGDSQQTKQQSHYFRFFSDLRPQQE